MSSEPTIRRNRMTLKSQTRATLWLFANAEAAALMTLSELTDKLNREAGVEHPMCDKNTKSLLLACGIECQAKEPDLPRQKVYDKMLKLQGMVERQDEVIADLIKQVKSLTGAVDLLSDTWAPTIGYQQVNGHN